jgi:hypothetical protein
MAQQKVKDARGPEENLTHFEPEGLYPCYRSLFEKFDTVFGRENVHLWKYVPGSFPSGCVVEDFCTRLGLALPRERVVHVNSSISRDAVALLYTYRKLGRELGSLNMTGPQNKRLVEALKDVGRKTFRISPEVVRPILQSNRADIQWMERRLGEPLHEELGEHQPGDVRDESDLLRPDPRVVAELRDMLGDAAPEGVSGETPEEVATLVHAVRVSRVRAGRPQVSGPGQEVQRASPHFGSGGFRHKDKGRVRNVLRCIDAKREQGWRLVRRFVDARLTRAKSVRGDTVAAAGKADAVAEETLEALLDAIEVRDAKALNGLSRAAAHVLVRSAFAQLNETVSRAGDGVIEYEELGQFRVKRVAGAIAGRGSPRKRIAFRPLVRG